MAILNPITIEAETLTLSANYEKESDERISRALDPIVPFASGNDLIRLLTATNQGDTGTASGNFSDVNGETGIYTITANIFDESDGKSTGTLQIGTNTLPSIAYDQNLNQNGISADNARSVTFDDVLINADDAIVFTGTREGNEVARLDSLVFAPIFTGALEFSDSSFSFDEGSGTVTISIVRTGGTTGQTTATVDISNGTADAEDYSATAQSSVVFAEGETTATVSISITDDALDEVDETISLALSSIDGESIIGAQATATVQILDNDEPIPEEPEEPEEPEVPEVPEEPEEAVTPQEPTPQFSDGDDVVTGTDDSDSFDALAGNDRVNAGAGNDQVRGGKGDDTLLGETGDDELNGDSGKDILKGGLGADTLIGDGGADTLRGNGGDDSLNGSGGRDRLFGNGGDDSLTGGSGRDRLAGGGGNDDLNGSGGRDTLLGRGGQDSLSGGGGADILTGGGGADIFILEAKAGVDQITDFNLNQDKLELSGSLAFGDLTFQNRNGNTLISNETQKLATLTGIQASQITESSFV